jgi:hypothetical protein
MVDCRPLPFRPAGEPSAWGVEHRAPMVHDTRERADNAAAGGRKGTWASRRMQLRLADAGKEV